MRNGLIPVLLVGVHLRKNRTIGRTAAQSPLHATVLAMTLLRVRCNRSTMPFACGWYGVARAWAIPLSLSHLVKVALVNWGPLSLVSFSGNPQRVKTCVRQRVTARLVVDLSAKASGYLDAVSMHVNIYLKPPLAVGKGPMMSIVTSLKGVVTTSLSFIIGGLGKVLSIA